jgi:predicted DNA-binding antitoxin AbrB/MazE fold protein
MSQELCEAVYENGVFRPLNPLSPSLIEGQRVRLSVETVSPEQILELASKVYEGLSAEEIEEIEEIALDRSHFFDISHKE